ncbi:Sterol carrier family protein [Tritonibacter mobilis]|jgi:putative sterol carrier protein|uniref:Sterol carrier family protein n=1 Tax=Tritonibacter mobilis F1926 TaxID=1265309 RepID=A0A1B1A3U4_9RHOB|nr:MULTISPECIES: SCP2 sterol-binding domain-containing protein [Tritonibacter]EEW58135.1 sterol-binding domain protein [Ruegeria sp. TrichCH4B]MBW3241223.1 SCP2 sterol-binding domain-containing protein [Epibacterium sp. DP7N7-1]MCZ4269218.1 SCP2 sterol-binding domain-containing protein [Rhodobacteraceae bacterium G21628-S1]MEE2811302.1 SCP2 sterol-binding domain-containing protein [Pseudomonadota bacterium]NKX36573.1 SCP2 sterol-binding domain-containing protein [Rhodobacteraceae bacterium R_S|eukprot:g18712.t1
MSDTLEQAAATLNEKMDGGFESSAKFEITGMGSIILDANGARVGDEEAEVTMTADAETFQEILSGELNPTAAFMGGKLTIDGDMGVAMQLAQALA